MESDGDLFFKHGDMVWSWDGGCYIYEWFEDSWEAMLWYGQQENLPRTIENVIENNVSSYKTWNVWDREQRTSLIPFTLEAFQDYVINQISKGTVKEIR